MWFIQSIKKSTKYKKALDYIYILGFNESGISFCLQGSYTAEVTSPYRQQSSNGPDVRGEFLPEELQSHQLPSPHTQHSGGVPDHSRVLTAPRSGDLRGSVDPAVFK